MKECFIADNYAVMCHAKQSVKFTEQVTLIAASIKICERVSAELSKKVFGKKVVIFHSPISRACLTADIVRDTLIVNGVAVVYSAELNCLECNKPGFNNEKVQAIIESERITGLGDVFVLFIGHRLDLKRYLGAEHEVTNCSIFSNEFSIIGHDTI